MIFNVWPAVKNSKGNKTKVVSENCIHLRRDILTCHRGSEMKVGYKRLNANANVESDAIAGELCEKCIQD